MPFYYSSYTGSGTRKDPFRPAGFDGHVWSALDLRDDPTVAAGFCFVYSPDTINDPAVTLVAQNYTDVPSQQIRNRIGQRLGVTIPNDTLGNIIGWLLTNPPAGRWAKLIPTGANYEIWLGSLIYTTPAPLQLKAEPVDPTDNFNRANETPLASPWTRAGTGTAFNLVSNALTKPTNPDDAYMYYSGAAATGDQFAQAKQVVKPTNNDWGPAVRVQGASGSATFAGYFFDDYDGPGGPQIGRHLNGSFTAITSWGVSGNSVAGDILRIEATGSTIKAFVNGTQYQSSATDSLVTGGQPGIFWYEPSGTLDDWSGGDLTTAKSSSDTNSTTTEAQSLAAQLSSTDANGTTTESASVNTGSTPKSSSDTNSTTTEAQSLAAQLSSADVDGTPAEAQSLVVQISASDTNGATTEANALAAQISTTDVDGATTEASKISQTAADQNSTTTEANSLTAGISTTDVNSTTTELGSTNTPKSGTDTNSTTTEANTLVATASSSDVNGTTTDTGSIGVRSTDVNSADTENSSLVTALAGTDANGATTEASGLALTAPGDSGSDSEAQSLKAALSGSETGSGSDTGTNGVPINGGNQTGSGSETSSLTAALSAADAGSDSETTTVVVQAISFETGSDTEISSLVASLIFSDTGLSTDLGTLTRGVTSTELGTSAETATAVAQAGNYIGAGAPDLILNTEIESGMLMARIPAGNLMGSSIRAVLVGAGTPSSEMLDTEVD